MESRSIQFILRACGGELLDGSPEACVSGVCTDSRQVRAGEVFVAIKGDRFDGHDFLTEVGRQAAAVVIERRRAPVQWSGCPRIVVEATRPALGYLAAAYRKDFTCPVVAVGGSNGKTSTKELVASVLRQKLTTLWSEASFNNEIGVPLTLLKLERGHQAAVVEAGTNHPGELEPLVRMIRPTLGIITSVGREHLEFFGDLAGVVREEGWLAELLPPTGKLLLSGDSEWVGAIRQRTHATVVSIGTAPGNDWRLHGLRLDKNGSSFRVDACLASYSGQYRINLLGRHQALNALFAIALGAELGLDRDQIEAGLAEAKPAKMRMQLWESNGVRVLDDAYNANADSMAAALQTLQELPCKGRRLAVLGDMAELGTHSEAAHAEVGRKAAESGVGQLFAVGKMAPVMARGAREGGLNRVLEFADVDTAAEAVKRFVKHGDLLLLKASRSTRLERIGDSLRGGEFGRKNGCSTT